MVVNAIVMTRVLAGPRSDTAHPAYAAVLRSTIGLYRQYPQLRLRSAFGAVAFAAFSLFWSTVPFVLSGEHYRYSPSTIGLFALLGAAGALAANQFSGICDRLDRLDPGRLDRGVPGRHRHRRRRGGLDGPVGTRSGQRPCLRSRR
ncbi:hypothetical protein QMK19_34705 [Streptomyces sp. H10-C2]|uniref:hypothetical protein n=1 Tax=unclassified Streptomyces TaxID=2593676 RepID=UPI0024BA6FA9|nr:MULTISPECIES: hypothetical protein [unclassified Streptomyces]MDJ0345747.1 hypothetical protein [Streptomyces sp. PH10-H1]MDJ0374637.1 hypothetical protein [Streptomyces sp. H10-C2]